ncbi:MAG: PfkB family carbohydrate kinase [Bacteroidales bacterium]|nr:PfkB family carbohydrate kinase [Clostridium sp.]MCM1204560.1 PfkB family carbohydrate kinase [Bacteroidales bacterium]
MRILIIGNIFETASFLVDNFCEKDSEVVANDMTFCVSGAAIVVSAIAAFLNLEPFLCSKTKEDDDINEILKKLSTVGVNTTLVDTGGKEKNILLTFYNSELERKCYSYTPNQVMAHDLLGINFSEFDATFFCCIPFEQVALTFEKNKSITNTKSIILASGLTSFYFENDELKVNSDYIFMNRGELLKIFEKTWNGEQSVTYDCCDKVNVGDTVLIVTMGKDGVFIKDHNKKTIVPVDNISNIVHPGGAGDAFSVGFIKGILRGNNYEECCKVGHECAKKMLFVKNVKDLLDKII